MLSGKVWALVWHRGFRKVYEFDSTIALHRIHNVPQVKHAYVTQLTDTTQGPCFKANGNGPCLSPKCFVEGNRVADYMAMLGSSSFD